MSTAAPSPLPASPQPDDADIMVEARGLTVGYPGRRVLEEVHLAVRRGEFWCLLGPNGSGKSTLLAAILGGLRPSAGKLVLGRGLAAGAGIGFVPQRCGLKRTLPMTVFEFVLLGLAGSGESGAAARAGVMGALDLVGLGSQRDAHYWSLSGGQRQRALVARGIVRRPDLLVLDEPTSGLDLTAEDSFLRMVSMLHRERLLTVLLVTHALALAARFATHVALFHAGRVLSGPRDEILVPGKLKSAYGLDVEVILDAARDPIVRVARGRDP
ncbi:MAG TPA: metal ABC transporter ATP-binding protein [Planctomycetota bacterium]|nr:metal ABC transporter ATP-binding protein [Planctomycetota bacterium]